MENEPKKTVRDHARKAMQTARGWVEWVRQNVPPGLRTVLGLLLVAAGILGFLPILGFWMIPLGTAIILLDVWALYRFIRLVIFGRR